MSEVELIVVARQTSNLPTQALVTRDGKQVVIGAVVVYSINNVVQAIGERNFNVYETVEDITASAIVESCTMLTYDELRRGLSSEVPQRLTRLCRKKLRQFGCYVHHCALTDFSTCRTYKVLGGRAATMANDE